MSQQHQQVQFTATFYRKTKAHTQCKENKLAQYSNRHTMQGNDLYNVYLVLLCTITLCNIHSLLIGLIAHVPHVVTMRLLWNGWH